MFESSTQTEAAARGSRQHRAAAASPGQSRRIALSLRRYRVQCNDGWTDLRILGIRKEKAAAGRLGALAGSRAPLRAAIASVYRAYAERNSDRRGIRAWVLTSVLFWRPIVLQQAQHGELLASSYARMALCLRE